MSDVIADADAYLASVPAFDLLQPVSLITRLKAEVERLQATVDKLPKTADGAPITPGMEVWITVPAVIPYTVHVIKGNDWIELISSSGFRIRQGREVFSTREAAEAKKEKTDA